MSLIAEVHNQRPAVRHTLFFLATVIAISGVGYMSISSLQKDVYFALNSNSADREAFLAARDSGRPNVLATISHAAGTLTASIGSLIGWNRDAGFDRGGQQDSMQNDVHLLPLSQ